MTVSGRGHAIACDLAQLNHLGPLNSISVFASGARTHTPSHTNDRISFSARERVVGTCVNERPASASEEWPNGVAWLSIDTLGFWAIAVLLAAQNEREVSSLRPIDATAAD